jgi:DNA-binding XRE family transcriptional regulator
MEQSWAVEFHDEFDPEFDALAEAVQDELLAQLKLLEKVGPRLGRPRVDTLNGSARKGTQAEEVAVGKTLKDKLDKLPAARRNKIEARADELFAEEMSLKDLRKARQMTQERMAQLLGIGQEGISRLEKRSDLLLSTLRNYVARMGGQLELVARFPDRPPVLLQDLAELGASPATASAPKKKRARTPQSTQYRVVQR